VVEQYRKVLERAKLARFEILTTWHNFQLKNDPFLSPLGPEDTEYFVDREKLIENVIFQVGVAERGIPMTILLVGPTGSGKSALINQVHNILKKIKAESPDDFKLKGELLSANYLFSTPEENDEEKIETQPWLRYVNEKWNYLFIDDASVNHIKTISREFKKADLIIYVISPILYPEILGAVPFKSKTIFMSGISMEDSKKMLDKRLEIASISKNVSVTKLFDDDALRLIWQYSMGIPSLILKNASKSLEMLMDFKNDKVTENIATMACKATKSNQAKQGLNLPKAKLEVLENVLVGRTPTELSSKLQKDRTTVSRQLNDLKKDDLVEANPRGRETVYKATEPVRIALELRAMPEVQ
jgi:DNA-binding transcriptional ArsR family regulator/guanylate kinase